MTQGRGRQEHLPLDLHVSLFYDNNYIFIILEPTYMCKLISIVDAMVVHHMT